VTLNGKKIIFKTVAICGLILGLIIADAQTAQSQMGPKEQQGTFGGALIGGLIGGAIGGRGGSAVVGAIAGTAIGGFIGNRIGASLDEKDRVAFARATRRAFSSGRTQTFSGRSGRGRAEVTSSSTVNGQPCRTVRQEVVLKDGSVLSDTVSACRGPNGWQV
jgi:surface antigen